MFALLLGLIQKLKRTKVDKIPGMGLSTNDYTNEEKLKLQNLISYQLVTTQKIQIINNTIELPSICFGVAFNIAQVYYSEDAPYMKEYSCFINNDRYTLQFNEEDNLSGSYCVVSYLTFRETE